MKIALHHNGTDHQVSAMKAMRKGLKKSGHQVVYTNTKTKVQADLHFIWSIKNLDCVSGDYIVLEAGYINASTGNYLKDRNRFISFSINGLHGQGKPHPEAPSSDRWDQLNITLKPWIKSERKLALLVGQHPLDAVTGKPYQQWMRNIRSKLDFLGVDYIYREHPLIKKSEETLEQQLSRADYAITYCSTAAVEAVLLGLPTIAYAESSIALPVTSRTIDEDFWLNSRESWCHQLAYRQWRLEELVDGSAWEWMSHVHHS